MDHFMVLAPRVHHPTLHNLTQRSPGGVPATEQANSALKSAALIQLGLDGAGRKKKKN